MGLFRSLSGLVEVEIVSADLPGTLAGLNGLDISLYQIRQADDLTVSFFIRRNDYSRLRRFCIRRGEALRLLHRRGLYWSGKSMLGRPVLLAGMLLLSCLLLYLPSRVFFVRIDGNTTIPANLILEAAEGCGICFGASRREVRSERVKNALLEAVPRLQWAGVNTSGCVATISVRERSVTDTLPAENAVSSIAAAVDGIITSCTAIRGNLLCKPGQAVKKGEILISGYTDCGLTIRATQAEGEVFAQTIRKIRAVMPVKYSQKEETGEVKRKISLLIGKNRINLWKDSGISGSTCGRMYAEYYITLPGDFRLPVALAVEEYALCEMSEGVLWENQNQLAAFAAGYIQSQMIAGSILSRDVVLSVLDGCCLLEGEYVCTEMIGRVQREQIGEYHGENR